MALNKEIERKWLVEREKLPFDLEECKRIEMSQAYISFSPTIRIRSENNERFILCVKTKPQAGSLVRDEYECEISAGEYKELSKKTDGIFIEKTRYLKEDENGFTMEIDVFKGVLEGLCTMEVEFESDIHARLYKAPCWAVKDVTSDSRYKNASLAKYGKIAD